MTDDLRPVVAAFDLDGTLTDGGSVFPWLVANAGLARVYRASLRLAVPLIVGVRPNSPQATTSVVSSNPR